MIKRNFLITFVIYTLIFPVQAVYANNATDLANSIIYHEFSVLKQNGDTGVRGEIGSCYRKISRSSSIEEIEYCFMLDIISSTIDEGVRANLGIKEDPTGFHNSAGLLSRVGKAFSRMHVDKSNENALISAWTDASLEAVKLAAN